MRVLDTVAPAGAINATARDMAQWVRFQLGRGAFDGRRLISAEQHQETWTPQIRVSGDVQYGMGWMVRTWRGQPLIEHGGNIDGFAATVALLPEAGLGFALLLNLSTSPLQQGSIDLIFGGLLDTPQDDRAEDDVADPDDLTAYLGKFVANSKMSQVSFSAADSSASASEKISAVVSSTLRIRLIVSASISSSQPTNTRMVACPERYY